MVPLWPIIKPLFWKLVGGWLIDRIRKKIDPGHQDRNAMLDEMITKSKALKEIKREQDVISVNCKHYADLELERVQLVEELSSLQKQLRKTIYELPNGDVVLKRAYYNYLKHRDEQATIARIVP